MEKNKRNIEIDILKGICIISVVFTHVGHPILWFGHFMVYGFYFTAGYTFKEKPFWIFFKEKICRIYFPFVGANVLVLFIIRLLSEISSVYNMTNLSIATTIKNSLVFTITNDLMAPSWFLFPLFLILFIFYFLNKWLKNKMFLFSITLLLFFVTHFFYNKLAVFQWCNCAFVTNVGIGLFLCTCGYILKNNRNIENDLFEGKYAIEVFVVSTILMFYISDKFGLDLRAGYCTNVLYSMLAILGGVYWVIYISKFLAKSVWISKAMACVGRYSMSIMFYHIIAFSIVTLGIHLSFQLPYPTEWPLAYTSGIYGLISGIVGIIVPMMLTKLFREYCYKHS